MPELESNTTSAEQARHNHGSETLSPSEDSNAKSKPIATRSLKKVLEEEAEKKAVAQKAREQARGELEKARNLELANEHFHSHAGIIYVPEEFWMRLYRASGPCHLYVSLEVVGKLPSPEAKSPGFLPDRGPPIPKLGGLPSRFKIVNQVLHEDMAAACGLKTALMNNNHVAPFRSIIPFEKVFRQRLLDAEKKFSEIAAAKPDHFAVLRQEPDWVPSSDKYSYAVPYPVTHVEAHRSEDDKIIRSRLLRDGYRALIYLMDHELHALVQDCRQIQGGTATMLPFPHLWHLFQPGQEIVTADRGTSNDKIQVYRVLQVTGGRREMLKKQSDKHKKRIAPNLVIDCFHLDFDGQEFGPVPHTIIIKPYEGMKAIRQLPAYPLTFSPESTLPHDLTLRGKQFVQLLEPTHRKYKGLSLRWNEPFDNVEEVRPSSNQFTPSINLS